SFCWTANILADRPKMTISGGRLLFVFACNRPVAVTSDIDSQLGVQKVCEFRQSIAFKAPIFSTRLKGWSSSKVCTWGDLCISLSGRKCNRLVAGRTIESNVGDEVY